MDNVIHNRHHAAMNDASAENKPVTERLRDLRKRTGMTMKEVADKLGYKGASSYQRYEDPNLFKDEYLPVKLVAKLEFILLGSGDPPINAKEIRALAGPKEDSIIKAALRAEIDAPRKSHYLSAAAQTPVHGEVATGVWLEIDTLGDRVDGTIPVAPHPDYPMRDQFAVRVRGTSVNQIAKDGDYLICVNTKKVGIEPRAGDLVLVHRIKTVGFILETSVKRMDVEPDGQVILEPVTDDPLYQQNILLEGQPPDTTVEIVGLVLVQVRFLTR